MSPHLSTLALHRLRYGELDDDAVRAARAHLDTCARCTARLAAQDNHRAAFELAPLPAGLRAPPAPRAGSTSPLRWLVGGIALVAGLVLITPSFLTGPTPDRVEEGVRTKGDKAGMEVWREASEGPRRVGVGETVSGGDRVQVRYRGPSAQWVTLVGVEASGAVEVYGAWEVDPEVMGWQSAPFAIQLDDAPGDQRLVLLFMPSRVSDEIVHRAARTGTPPRGGEVREVTLRKAR